MKILYPEGKKKALTFSYDDNQIHDRRLIELFHQYDLKGTFHINSGSVGKSGGSDEFIQWNELSKLYAGQEVACHTVNHTYLVQLPKGRLLEELLMDKQILEKETGYPIRGLSYPFGQYSDEVITMAEQVGFEYSRTVEDTCQFSWPVDFMKWHPTCHHNKAFERDDLLESFLNCPGYFKLPLFYIWGHSFEFQRQDTWAKMEQLCKKLSGKNDVWYATNIQIKEYICAVRNLVFSADQSMVYNPSAVTIYYEANGQILTIGVGEQKKAE